MITKLLAYSFWAQNRTIQAAIITIFVLAAAGLFYFLYQKRDYLAKFVQAGWIEKVILVYRFILGGAAIFALIALINPIDSVGMGALLYPIFILLLMIQVALAAKLPWKKLIKESPGGVLALAFGIGFYAGGVDSSILHMTGYLINLRKAFYSLSQTLN